MEYVLTQREIFNACAYWIVMEHGIPSKGLLVNARYELIPDPETSCATKEIRVTINLKRKDSQDMLV